METIKLKIGSIAHDYNNILSVIMGYADLTLVELPSDNPAKENIKEIIKNVKLAASLTHQLFAISKDKKIAPTIVNLNDVLFDMKGILRFIVGENIQFHMSLSDNPCIIKVIPGHIEQIITNLVINARDSIMDLGKISIKTNAVTFDEKQGSKSKAKIPHGKYVLLVVSDTGAGMDDTTLSHIFDPFYTTKQEGNGLGLSICHRIIKQYRGYIYVESKPDHGTTFTIYLPQYLMESAARYQENTSIERETKDKIKCLSS